MHIAVTGAGGRIGALVSSRLAARHTLRGIDIRATADYPGEFIVGDCADPRVANAVADGVDAVVHLAGNPSSSTLPDALHSHVTTTAVLLDAMVHHDVRRMVYASSNHAVGLTPRVPTLSAATPPRPDTFYGVGKVAAESLLSLYADKHAISSVAVRIGSFLERPQTRRNLATWLSYDDCTRLVEAALTADFDGVRTVYGISANTDAWWDLEPGRAIGYYPKDDARDWVETLPHRAEDDAENAYVGGPFAADPSYDREALSELPRAGGDDR